MNIYRQYSTVEQGKKLFAYGITDSKMSWIYDTEADKFKLNMISFKSAALLREKQPGIEYYPAFSVAELGEMIMSKKYMQSLPNKSYTGGWFSYMIPKVRTEAEARAALLIYLVQNNILNADTVNENLAAA